MRYTVLLDWDPDADEYAVSVPVLPGCFTHGPTVELAVERAKEAIEGFISALAVLGEVVPVEEPALIPVVVDVETEVLPLAATG